MLPTIQSPNLPICHQSVNYAFETVLGIMYIDSKPLGCVQGTAISRDTGIYAHHGGGERRLVRTAHHVSISFVMNF
jgi:hypothetical protein